jgi:hypothetical protein
MNQMKDNLMFVIRILSNSEFIGPIKKICYFDPAIAGRNPISIRVKDFSVSRPGGILRNDMYRLF